MKDTGANEWTNVAVRTLSSCNSGDGIDQWVGRIAKKCNVSDTMFAEPNQPRTARCARRTCRDELVEGVR